MYSIYTFLLSFLLSWTILFFSISILRKKLVVKPNNRSSHYLPKPTGGGISFVFVTTFICLFFRNYIPLIALPLSYLGLIDDRINVPSKFRFIAQILSIILLLFLITNTHELSFLNNNLQDYYSIFSISIIILIGVSLINFVNFMDGIDGLVSGCMIIVFLILSISLDNSLWSLVGSLLGFIFWNWSPSKVFMGDIGSYFLGCVFSGILLTSKTWQEFLSIILLTSPLMLDALVCVIRRYFAGQNIFKPHKLHLYQRLHQAGFSHSKVAIIYMSATSLVSLFYIYQNLIIEIYSVIAIFLIGIYLDRKLAKPFVISN